MKLEDFNKIVIDRTEKCKSILVPKGKEYTRNGDRLWNFKRAADLQGITPEKALVGMWTKHLISVLDIVNDIEEAKLPSSDLIDEKFTDTITYVMLLEALLMERKDKYGTSKQVADTLVNPR